jgi:hypothetical protein
VCTLAVKKDQGRFRHVGSDHSLVSETQNQLGRADEGRLYAPAGNRISVDQFVASSFVLGKFMSPIFFSIKTSPSPA